MRPIPKLLAFAVALLAVLGVGYGIGDAVGPFDDGDEPRPVEVHGGHP